VAEIEIFTPTGVLAGETAHEPMAGDGADITDALPVSNVRWYPIDGGKPSHRGDASVLPDDILVIVSPAPELFVHMAWYTVTLEVGPYEVTGELATHPGFDPARALARPGSGFVPLRDVTVRLAGHDDAGAAQRAYAHVNRYAVTRAQSDLMLGYFFPGAQLVTREPAAVG